MKEDKFKIGNAETVALTIGAILLLLVLYNGIKLSGVSTGVSLVGASEIIPKGVPAVYGSELGVSYDDISPSNPRGADVAISKLKQLDITMELSGADLERYIRVTGAISCEYCCGADSIIFPDGQAACGCAHSYAMRGLAKYLITEHSNEFTDEEILAELGKWKVLFFPDIHEAKASVMKSQGIEINYISLASNQYRGIEQGAQAGGGGMVGGC
ncbi:MAG: hypothetical protein NUV97_02130 [archaeon]|nr:hypothetical protein [archaeon]MCR4323749.1 hypothetical protein [Nanoarchaeota archaeon]